MKIGCAGKLYPKCFLHLLGLPFQDVFIFPLECRIGSEYAKRLQDRHPLLLLLRIGREQVIHEDIHSCTEKEVVVLLKSRGRNQHRVVLDGAYQLTVRIILLQRTKAEFRRKFFSCNRGEKGVVFSFHGNVNVVIPWNEALMPHGAEQCSVINKIANMMSVTDFVNFN